MKTKCKILFFNLFFLGLIILCSNQIYAHGGGALKCHFNTATPVLIPISNTGYVSGNNGFGDIEIAQKYGVNAIDLPDSCNATDSATMSEVHVWFGKKVTGVNGNVIVKVYSSNPLTGAPDQLLSTSFPLNMNSLDTSMNIDTVLTTFLLQTPITITDTFFVSVLLPTSAGDSVAIISDTNGQGQNMKLGWIRDSNNTWLPVQTLRNLDIDFAIYPAVVDPVSGINENKNLSSKIKVYPNPVKEQLNIEIDKMQKTQSIAMDILNIEGKVIQQISWTTEEIQTGKKIIPTSSFPLGTYFYSIISDKEQAKGKFIVIQ